MELKVHERLFKGLMYAQGLLVQLYKNLMVILIARTLFKMAPIEGAISPLILIPTTYLSMVVLKTAFEITIIRDSMNRILDEDDTQYSKHVKEEVERRKREIILYPLPFHKSLYLQVKRDVLVGLFSLIAIPIAPQIFTIMQNIPTLHYLYPKDTQPQVAKRAAAPYKLQESAYRKSTLYLLVQGLASSIGVLALVYYNKTLKGSVLTTTLGGFGGREWIYLGMVTLYIIGLVVSTKRYVKWTYQRIEVALTTSVKIDYNKPYVKQKGILRTKLNGIMGRVKDGFK